MLAPPAAGADGAPSFAPADPRLPRSVLLAVSLRRAHRTLQCASVPASLAFYAFFVVFIIPGTFSGFLIFLRKD